MAADHILQQHNLRHHLADLFTQRSQTLIDDWMTRLDLAAGSDDYAMVYPQAQRLIAALAHSFTAITDDITLTPRQDQALQRAFPLVYRMQAMLVLAQVIADNLAATGLEQVAITDLFTTFTQCFSAIDVVAPDDVLYTDRLSRLSRFSWSLNSLQDREAILAQALCETPALVGAEDCIIWMWDADREGPHHAHTREGCLKAPVLPPTLLTLLRQVQQTGCVFSIDADETDLEWPLDLSGRAIAFIPLQGHAAGLGVVSVRHALGRRFSHDEIFLLSALGNRIATALTNAEMHRYERLLIELLQSSILEMVQAAGGGSVGREEFIAALVQVGKGLTRADALCVVIEQDGRQQVTCAGALAPRLEEELHIFGTRVLAQRHAVPAANAMVPAPAPFPPYMALAEIRQDGQLTGIIYALRTTPFSDEQHTFLQTVADQIGVGCANMQKTDNNQRMLVQLANMSYVSATITSTYEASRIFSVVSLAASQALVIPVALCGWFQEDGTIQVDPATVIGLNADEVARLNLTDHNPMIRRLLEQRNAIHSRQVPAATLRRAGLRDWLCVPMIVQERVRGILLVADRAPRLFTIQDIALLTTYANQVSLAMTNAILYTEVERQYRQMDHLYRLSRTFSTSPSEEALLTELVAMTAEALQTPVVLACLADPRSGGLTLTTTHGITLPGAPLRWDADEGVIGKVAHQRQTLTSTNLLADGRDAQLHDLAQRQNLVAALAVPLAIQHESLGTLLVAGHEARDFTSTDQQLLQAIAHDAAMALRTIRIRSAASHESAHLQQIMSAYVASVDTITQVVGEMLEIARTTEANATGILHARQRLEVLDVILHQFATATPQQVEINEVIRRLFATPGIDNGLAVRVTGTSIDLPVRFAAYLALWIYECIHAIATIIPVNGDPQIIVAFHLLGDELLVVIEDGLGEDSYQIPMNPAILHAISTASQGSIQETVEGKTHRIRFRCSRPSMPNA